MKLINFEENKDKKEYGVNSLIEDVKGVHDEEGIELLIVVYKKKNGVVGIGTTAGNNAEILGLIEMGKIQYLDDNWG